MSMTQKIFMCIVSACIIDIIIGLASIIFINHRGLLLEAVGVLWYANSGCFKAFVPTFSLWYIIWYQWGCDVHKICMNSCLCQSGKYFVKMILKMTIMRYRIKSSKLECYFVSETNGVSLVERWLRWYETVQAVQWVSLNLRCIAGAKLRNSIHQMWHVSSE